MELFTAALVAAVGALIVALIQRHDGKIDDLRKRMESGFARFDAKFDAVDARFDAMGQQVIEMERHLTLRIDGLYGRTA